MYCLLGDVSVLCWIPKIRDFENDRETNLIEWIPDRDIREWRGSVAGMTGKKQE
jgi:hypothetical protein